MEIMIVVAIICLLAAIAMPGWLRSRKRSQAARILDDLRMIDSAVDQYAVETNKTDGMTVEFTDWQKYLRIASPLYVTGQNIFGHDYGPQLVGSAPKVPDLTRAALSDVTDYDFWSPYN